MHERPYYLLALKEVGLPYDFRDIVAEHVGFYESQKRLESLRDLVTSDETPGTVRLKMMAVLQGAAPNIDDLLYGFLNKPANNSLIDKVDECLGQANLIVTFWKEVAVTFGYANPEPSLRDFVTTLFRWANPLDSSATLDPHAKVFLQRWKDSQVNCHSFREWAKILEAELHIAERLDAPENVRKIGSSDTFPIFEKSIIHWLCKAFEKDTAELSTIRGRRGSFWFRDHQHGYEALEQAITLRQLLKSAELNVETVDAGISRYIATWHRIDTAYRLCQYHLRAYGQIALMDKVGDSLVTEARTTAAVETALDELEQILRKIANANGNNMLITADHGFMFQQSAVEGVDDLPLPEAADWLYNDRRFALGRGIVASLSVKLFTAAELGLTGEWTAAFPLALGRFPLRGSGKRYVHGGVSLQEVIIPVLRVHKARMDDTEQVDVDLLRVPAKITTGQVSLALYQDQPVADKVLPRILRVGVFTVDGLPLSEVRTMTFDSGDTDPRHREKSVVLTLARTADEYNNQEVEIRLEETITGTTQIVVYKSHRIKLQKPFASDFDDF